MMLKNLILNYLIKVKYKTQTTESKIQMLILWQIRNVLTGHQPSLGIFIVNGVNGVNGVVIGFMLLFCLCCG